MFTTEERHWWYRVRREIVLNLLADIRKNLGREISILDVGCGAGGLLKELGRFGNAYGIDVSEDAVQFGREHGVQHIQLGSVSAIPYPDNHFDVVCALDVLEHVQHDHAAVNEIRRVLRPGGRAIVSVPAFPSLWGITDVLSYHYRRYRLRPLTVLAMNSGFEIIRATYFNTILFIPIALVRLTVRMLGLRVGSENQSFGFLNELFYRLFHMETMFLKYMNLPFGISILMIAQKLQHEENI